MKLFKWVTMTWVALVLATPVFAAGAGKIPWEVAVVFYVLVGGAIMLFTGLDFWREWLEGRQE